MITTRTARNVGRAGGLLLLLLVALFVLLPAHAEKVAAMPAPTGYVDDYAHVLTPAGQARLEAICTEVHEKTRAQIFLVTVQSLDGQDAAPFANELFAKWKIGEKKTDSGILILLSIGDHKRWTEVGYGLEGILNDAKVGDIGREMVPDLKAADYDGAGLIGVERIAGVIAADRGVTLSTLKATDDASGTDLSALDDPTLADPNQTNPNQIETTQASSHHDATLLILFLGGWCFFLLVIVLFLRGRPNLAGGGGSRSSSGGSSSSGGWSSGGSSSSGGWSSGSSSSNTSSSSDSDFSGGDGGSSGGGGAGGDW